MSTQSNNILEVIPPEILAIVLEEVKRNSFSSLRDMRLVSRDLSSLVEPLVFTSITLRCYKLKLAVFRSQLECLASGNSPNSRWTKRLRIFSETLPPLVKMKAKVSLHGDRESPEHVEHIRRSALAIQKAHLLRSIEALKEVTHVIYHPAEVEVYVDVLNALSRMPKLEQLSLTFCSDFYNKPLPLASFSNLRVVELLDPRSFPSVMSSIAGLLVRSSSSLESLTITPYHIYWEHSPSDTGMVRVVGLERLLAGDIGSTPTTKPSPSFLSKLLRSPTHPLPKPLALPASHYPQLRKVVINSNRVSLSAAVVPYLPSLIHVEASNRGLGPGNIDDSFWNALTTAKIRLEYIDIWPITKPIVQYLSSYSGLKTLHLRSPKGTAAAGAEILNEEGRLLTVVLPRHHGHMLDELWLEGPNGGCSGVWGTGFHLTEKTLEGVTGCSGLRTLSICYYFPPSERMRRMNQEVPEERPVRLNILLSQLASSPHMANLQLVIIKPTHKVPTFGCGTGRRMYLDSVRREFIDVVTTTDVTGGTPSFLLEVRGILGDRTLRFEPEKGRFVVIYDSQRFSYYQ